jgi:hypothetical protein
MTLLVLSLFALVGFIRYLIPLINSEASSSIFKSVPIHMALYGIKKGMNWFLTRKNKVISHTP